MNANSPSVMNNTTSTSTFEPPAVNSKRYNIMINQLAFQDAIEQDHRSVKTMIFDYYISYSSFMKLCYQTKDNSIKCLDKRDIIKPKSKEI